MTAVINRHARLLFLAMALALLASVAFAFPVYAQDGGEAQVPPPTINEGETTPDPDIEAQGSTTVDRVQFHFWTRTRVVVNGYINGTGVNTAYVRVRQQGQPWLATKTVTANADGRWQTATPFTLTTLGATYDVQAALDPSFTGGGGSVFTITGAFYLPPLGQPFIRSASASGSWLTDRLAFAIYVETQDTGGRRPYRSGYIIASGYLVQAGGL